MKRSPFHCMLVVVLVCSCMTAHANLLTSKILFGAQMTSAQEVPALTLPGIGVASFQLNNGGDTLCITATVNGLSDAIIGVQIQEAEIGVSGPVVKDLTTYLSGNSLQATLNGADLTWLEKAKLFSGSYYINVKTTTRPLGEIRGQILPEEDRAMLVKLSGAQEAPPVTTVAKGLAFFIMSKHNQKLSFYVVLDSLNGTITGAHLHQGIAGTSGPIIEDLMSFLNGNIISGSVDPSMYLNAILADSIYINVHTSTNPAGSIRGQLHFGPYLHFDGRMTGSQETPSVATNAVGLSVFRTNYTMDTVWYDMLVSGISGPITASHIHKGPLGTAGPILVPFPSPNINGHSISGYFAMPVGAAADSLRKQIMEGGLYANVHTAANPAGEIRGQIYKTIREGYTFAMTGAQQVPSQTTAAYGSGLLSIDRDQTNAHFMIAGTNITPTFAHFHAAPVSVSGPVVFDLAPYISGSGIFGYWRENDALVPFSAAFSDRFRNDSMYVNIHTNTNPAGEIRGQVGSTLCTSLPTSTAIRTLSSDLAAMHVYPNPTSSNATISLNLAKPLAVSIQLSDVMGRVIWKSDAVLSTGMHQVDLPTASLAGGMYYILLTSTDGQISRKLLKEQ